VVSKAYALQAATNRPAAIVSTEPQLVQSPPGGSIGVRFELSTFPSTSGTMINRAIGSRLTTPSSCWMRALSLTEKWLTQKIASSAVAPMIVAPLTVNGPQSELQSQSGSHCVCT
jgi:hypothetical protein